MTIVEPLPDLQWGKGNWQDYISNWRTRDTSWMQERLVLRYQTTALRNAAWAAPGAGQVTYNDETKSLEMWRAAPTSAWVRSLMFQFLTSNKDDSAGVNISHSGAAGKGIQLTPTSLLIDATTTNFLNGVHVIDATGITVKVGAKTAKLSTDATNLVSDSPIKAPSATIDAITTSGAIGAGSISAASATLTNIGMSGTLSGGVINGSSGTIGSIGLAAGVLTVAAGSAAANAPGIQAGQGYFYGDTNSAVMRQRTSAGVVPGAAFVQAQANTVVLNGTTLSLSGQAQVAANRSMQYLTTAGTFNGGPVIAQTADPGVGNVPEGTIWIQV